jgi:hypothetical protein
LCATFPSTAPRRPLAGDLDSASHPVDADCVDRLESIEAIRAIQYGDDSERRAGAWYFVRRRHLLWYGAELGESPVGLPPANWPEHHTGTVELPVAEETWRDLWGP